MMGLFLDYAGGVLSSSRRTPEQGHIANAMADERDDTEHTEDPTPRRLEEAIKRGDVVKSTEVITWFMIGGGTLMLMVFAGPMAHEPASDVARPARAIPTRFPSTVRRSPSWLKALATQCACRARRFRFCCWRSPRWSATSSSIASCSRSSRSCRSCRKISPAAGLRRLFSKQALANFAKGLAKLALFGAVIGALLWPQRHAPRRSRRRRSGDDPAVHPVAGDEDAGRGGRDPRHHRGGRLPVPVPAMVRAAENVAAGNEGGVPPERGRSRRSRARSGRCARRARASA